MVSKGTLADVVHVMLNTRTLGTPTLQDLSPERVNGFITATAREIFDPAKAI